MSRVGREAFRRQFADWAGHNCANMDYLTREQVNGNISEDDIDIEYETFIERLYHAISSIACKIKLK